MMLLPGRSRLTWREHCAGQTPEKQLNEQQIVAVVYNLEPFPRDIAMKSQFCGASVDV
jgi:hypothetical protein